MLIAMAVTLLLMAALGKGFGMIGESIRDSRTQVELTNELRDISTRIKDELRWATVAMRPSVDQQEPSGYFLYYEGPLTDASSSLYRASPFNQNSSYAPESRYGDFDDYLAFTAVASGDNWFTGKVPRFILDQKTAELAGGSYDPDDFPGNPWDAVMIRSKYAEIVYFASPEYVTASLPATPTYVDANTDSGDNGNGLPDNIRIHRRVLLIRPDLNLNSGFIQPRPFGGIRYMLADAWPVATRVDNDPNGTATDQATLADGWLYGMAGVHQQCDLSLRRVLDNAGRPTQNVAANSLEDLAKPHNRFAHVRVPGSLIGLQNTETSMPVLALSGAAGVMNSPSLADDQRIAPPPGAVLGGSPPPAASVITPMMLSGTLRPEFVLGYDRNHPSNPNHPWGSMRVGEDVLASGALAFDIKVFDRRAPVFTTLQGQVVEPHSAAYREAFREALLRFGDDDNPPVVRRGEFVDLAYPVLAGGSMRGWQPRRFDRLTPGGNQDGAMPIDPSNALGQFARGLMISEFSGLANPGGGSLGTYTGTMYRSGKILVDGGNRIRLFQPTFDTFTFFYEHDGYLQLATPNDGAGTRWELGVPGGNIPFDLAADGLNRGGVIYGGDNFFERETAPPFLRSPRALQVTVRLENQANRQFRQISVVHQGQR